MIRRPAFDPVRPAVIAYGILGFSLVGCGGGGAGGSSSDDLPVGELGSQLFEMESHSADVTLSEGGRVVSPDAVDEAYLGREEGGVLRFRDDADEISGLETGMIVSLGRRGIRRIDGIERSGGEIRLRTSQGALNELIEDASIEWSGRMSFARVPAQASLLPRIWLGDRSLAVTQASNTEINYEGTLKGYKVKFTLKPSGSRLEVSITGERATPIGGKTGFSAEGWISDFPLQGRLDYESQSLEVYETSIDDLQGELEVKFSAIDLGSEEVSFVLPAKIAIPFRIWLFPAEVGIGGSVTIKPQFHAHGSSQAGFKVSYGGRTGISYESGGLTMTGGLLQKNFSLTDETVSASTLAVGMGLQIDFPLMELSIAGGTAVLSFVNKTNIHSFYDPALNHAGPPEQSGGIDLKGLAQVKLGILGVEVTETKELWSEELNLELDR